MRTRLLSAGAVLIGASIITPGCGGAPVVPTKDAAMGSTFAGSRKCEADAHNRPFIIEWDATDMSSFESRASKDLIFVRYEGCELEVLDGCSDDGIPGHYGAYKPPRWTSGSVEKVNIDSTADLYAKLPLGVATLGGKVERGIKLDMEYYVSGEATATRDAVYRETIAANQACAGATHFVYGYNLGAFAIYSKETAHDSASADVPGAGVGGQSKRSRQTEKRGGELDACRGTTAADSDKCRIPIRLTLRRISDGADPAPKGPPPPDAPLAPEGPLLQAGKIRNGAGEKMQLKDGKGCLADLDRADRIDPDPTRSSRNPKGLLHLRATCEMLTGDCESGKLHLRQARQAQMPGVGPDVIDNLVNTTASQFCTLDKLDHWSQMDQLNRDMYFAVSKSDANQCRAVARKINAWLDKKKKPENHEHERMLRVAYTALGNAGGCLAKAGHCAEGKKLDVDSMTKSGRPPKEPAYTRAWEKKFPACQGK